MQKQERDSDAGIGLVEIVISMFLLALLAVSFLPLLVDALRASVRNSSVATANSLMSEQLDSASAVGRTCDALVAWAAASVPTLTDERGTVYTPDRVVIGCPAAAYPATARVTVSVDVSLDPAITLEATTLLVVESTN